TRRRVRHGPRSVSCRRNSPWTPTSLPGPRSNSRQGFSASPRPPDAPTNSSRSWGWRTRPRLPRAVFPVACDVGSWWARRWCTAPVLVLDEPTAGVDVALRQQLWDYVRLLNRQGTTVLLTTHYLQEAEALCDQIAVLADGQI